MKVFSLQTIFFLCIVIPCQVLAQERLSTARTLGAVYSQEGKIKKAVIKRNRFAFSALTGDGEIEIKAPRRGAQGVESLGLMIRSTLLSNPTVSLFGVTKKGKLDFRTVERGKSRSISRALAKDVASLKLLREGDRITAMVSQGESWTTFASASIELPSTVYIGVYAEQTTSKVVMPQILIAEASLKKRKPTPTPRPVATSTPTIVPTAAPTQTPVPTVPLATPTSVPRVGTGFPSDLSFIKSVLASSRCVDVDGAQMIDGNGLILYDCHYQSNQQFFGTGAGEIRTFDGSFCFDTNLDSNGISGRIILKSCNGSPSQKWQRVNAQIVGANGGCLELKDSGQTNWTWVQLNACTGAPNQDWSVVRAGGASPTPAPTATLTPQPTVTGVAVFPGESIQAKVNLYPAGTTFLIKSGTHLRQSVIPKNGNVFIGEAGAVLDGGGNTEWAFWPGYATPYPSNVKIERLKITKYAPPVQFGPVRAGGHTRAESTSGWVIADCDISYNATGGIRIGNSTQVLRNKIHHNEQIGIVGIGDNVLVEGNEISYQNINNLFEIGFEAGGTKFVLTRNLVVRNNFSHHNNGPGLWTDIDNIYTTYENNRVEDNTSSGIFHEISFDAVIRNNTLLRNGFVHGAWMYGGGITVSASTNVEIYGNTVIGNYAGITGIQQARDMGEYGVRELVNLYVHDNNITMSSGRTGVGQDVGNQIYFTAKGNRFARNTYNIAGNARPFEWMDGQRTVSEWRAYGQDTTGTFNQ